MDLRAHVVGCTGWTWGEVGTLTLPRLHALFREWRRHPPVHHLVAAFIGHEPPAAAPAPAPADDDAAPPWTPPGTGIAASPALQAATSAEDGLAAAERMFFGDVKNVEQL